MTFWGSGTATVLVNYAGSVARNQPLVFLTKPSSATIRAKSFNLHFVNWTGHFSNIWRILGYGDCNGFGKLRGVSLA